MRTAARVAPGAGKGGLVRSWTLKETSGLAASAKNPGELWLHNDSGDTARVFAIDQSGAVPPGAPAGPGRRGPPCYHGRTMTSRCPKCSGALRLEGHRIPMAVCAGCRGVWLSVTALLAQLTGDPYDAVTGLMDQLRRAPAREQPRQDPYRGRTLRCVGCNQPLQIKVVGGVELEHCSRCEALFLDRGELTQLAERFPRPVIERGSPEDQRLPYTTDSRSEEKIAELLHFLFWHG
jgi:Zn-finger nucleic acid-binding protein